MVVEDIDGVAGDSVDLVGDVASSRKYDLKRDYSSAGTILIKGFLIYHLL